MRMGCDGPSGQRKHTDLGRFGLGMKTAFLSQGRRLTVITRTNRKKDAFVRRWDIPFVRENGWRLLAEATPVATEYLKKVNELPIGHRHRH